MRGHNKTYCLIALVLGRLLSGLAAAAEQDAVWEVLSGGLPVRVSVEDASINSSIYVLKQTHEPLFRRDDGEIVNSRLLKRWSRNPWATEFELCPDTSFKFDEQHIFSLEYFQDYISKVAKIFDKRAVVSGEARCVKISFKTSRKEFLKFLTSYEYAPTVKKNKGIELGLGKFIVESISKNQLVLKRREPERRAYNKIIFHQYAGPADPNLKNRQISDFNNIPSFDIPEWVKAEYFHFDSPILRSIDLIINHPDKDIRKAVYNCMDYNALRRAYVPKRSSFIDIKNMLPIGVPGAEAGSPIQNCKAVLPVKAPEKQLAFLNLAYDNDKEMSAFCRDFQNKTGIKVDVIRYPDNEVDAAVFNFPRRYNMVVVVIDAVRPDSAAFFDYLVGTNSYFDSAPPFLGKQYLQMLREDGGKSVAESMAAKLGEEALVLPLYQNIGTFYYPQKIKNMIVGRGFIEYPEVADFRW